MSYLFEIRNEVQHFAEVISEALHVETEIIDEEWVVVGTTSYTLQEYLIDWNFSNSKITRHVFETKRPLLLSDPMNNALCRNCVDREQCYYKAGLYYPILQNNHCHGVISLVAFDEEQRQNIMDNHFTFMKFTGKMAEILGSKIEALIVMEELSKTNEYLDTIISSVHEGVIACDAKGVVTCFNHTAQEKLGIHRTQAVGAPIAQIIPNSLLLSSIKTNQSIYEKSVQYEDAQGSPLHLISNTTLVKNGNQILGAVESFNTDESLYRIAHRLLSHNYSASFNNIIGESKTIRDVKACANAVAKSPSTILITGESGTGKELFARSIHHASLRAERLFIPINCGAIPDALLESELFGYEGGAFTGAKTSGKPGIFEMAQGGTIFLDEIGDMPLNLQVKLLRVLQEKTIQRLGATKTISVDVRVIAATHQDLKEKMERKEFREDLFYRLNVIPITIPPLRNRIEDIPLLVDFFTHKYAHISDHPIGGIAEDALRLLSQYKWPGNIRELENAIEYAMNYSFDDKKISRDSLPSWLFTTTDSKNTVPPPLAANRQQNDLQEAEKNLILQHLNTYGSNLKAKKQISTELGISLSTLYRKMQKYKLL